MRSGLVTWFVAVSLGVAGALIAGVLLADQPPLVREPVAQGVGASLAFVSLWPWMRQQNGRMIQRFGFIGDALWVLVGVWVIVATRLYLRTG